RNVTGVQTCALPICTKTVTIFSSFSLIKDYRPISLNLFAKTTNRVLNRQVDYEFPFYLQNILSLTILKNRSVTMSKKYIITFSVFACIALIAACTDKNDTSSENNDYKAHDMTEIKTTLEEKSAFIMNGYSPLAPADVSQKLEDHYNEQEKAEMPKAEAKGGNPERRAPLGDVLLKEQEDTTNGRLKHNQLVAYSGTPHSKAMGSLGEYSPEDMMKKLKERTQEYSDLDPERPAIPTIELIATVAQRSPGPEDLYITPPDDDVIQEYIDLAEEN